MIIFDARNIVDYHYTNDFIEQKRHDFITDRDCLFNKYGILEPNNFDGQLEQYQKFRNEYRAIINQLILSSIHQYRHFLPTQCLIYIFGSIAKHTDRVASDVDLTICYDAQKELIYETAEELINFTITRILGYTIDHIHGKFQHYPPMKNFDHLTEIDNKYRLLFNGHHVDYYCGPESLKENLMHIKNVRDYDSLIKGYQEKYTLQCDIDCLYSIKIVENTTPHDFFKDLQALEKAKNICDQYQFSVKETMLPKTFTASFLKQELKSAIVEFYIFISRYRKILNFQDEYSMTIDTFFTHHKVIRHFGDQFIVDLKKVFLEFVFFWNRLEYTLNKLNIKLSTRSYHPFSILSINHILTVDWKSSTSIEMIFEKKNHLITLIQKGLKLNAISTTQ